MLTPCETVTKSFLPAIKAAIVKELSSKYSFTQDEIGLALGLTQPAIHKYLSGKYSGDVKKLESNDKLKKIAEDVSNDIAKQKNETISKKVCSFCEKFHGNVFECKISANRISDSVLERLIEMVEKNE